MDHTVRFLCLCMCGGKKIADTRVVFGFGFALVLLCRVINKLKHLLYISCITLCVYIERNSYVDKSIRIFLGSK